MSETAPALSQRTLHEVFGTLLIGSWISTLVFVFQITQIHRYFTLYPVSWRRTDLRAPSRAITPRQDRLWIPIMVLWMFSMDLIATVTPYVMAYTWLVLGWGNVAMLGKNVVLLVPYTIGNALCILTMHMFLLSRYYTLSRRAVVSAGLLCMALVSCGWFIAAGFLAGIVYPTDRGKIKPVIIAWLICSATTDWLIAGSLMWTLSRVRTTIDDTQGLIARIIRISILSGSIPTVLVLVCLIAFMASPDTNYSMLFSQCLGSVGSLTVLYNLNSRGALANSVHGTTDSNSVGNVISTTIGSGQLFCATTDGWSSSQTNEGVPMRSLWIARRNGAKSAARKHMDQSRSNNSSVGLDSKPTAFDSEHGCPS